MRIEKNMTPESRQPKTEETFALQHIWKTVFGDSDEIVDKFFETYFEPQMTAVTDGEAGIASAGYLLPVGSVRINGRRFPCAMVYAVATLPQYRGMGYATANVRQLISMGRAAGFKASILRPSEKSLFEYYAARTPLQEWFYANERTYGIETLTIKEETELIPATAEEYFTLRETLLSDIPHIEFDLRALAFQEFLCHLSGGGLYRVETPGGDACAIVEKQPDGSVWIKELLTPPSCEPDALSAVASKHPAHKYHVRGPVDISACPSEDARFGMLSVDADGADRSVSTPKPLRTAPRAPYYGPAFD